MPATPSCTSTSLLEHSAAEGLVGASLHLWRLPPSLAFDSRFGTRPLDPLTPNTTAPLQTATRIWRGLG